MSYSSFGQMQTTLIGNVESITNYEIDSANRGASIWMTKPNTGKNPRLLGNEILKIRCPYEMFDQLASKVKAGDYTFPGVYEVLADIDMGGQNKAVLSAVSVRKYIPVDTETGEIESPVIETPQTTTKTNLNKESKLNVTKEVTKSMVNK